jgi:hypothetical protein
LTAFTARGSGCGRRRGRAGGGADEAPGVCLVHGGELGTEAPRAADGHLAAVSVERALGDGRVAVDDVGRSRGAAPPRRPILHKEGKDDGVRRSENGPVGAAIRQVKSGADQVADRLAGIGRGRWPLQSQEAQKALKRQELEATDGERPGGAVGEGTLELAKLRPWLAISVSSRDIVIPLSVEVIGRSCFWERSSLVSLRNHIWIAVDVISD